MPANFNTLFRGGTHAHGVWDLETGPKTLHEPATEADYEAHLAGRVGLGIIPVNTEGLCSFAAIDIDVDTIDHRALRERIVQRQMPLTVCRSKSGGAHLYLFVREPMKASVIIPLMKRWAGLAGFPRAEIFPKQSKVTASNIGNWINLPFANALRTVRYSVGPNGAQSLEEFLETVTYWDGEDKVDYGVKSDLVKIEDMPPCLAALTREGVPEGGRNSGLFNFAVFFRKSSPNGWEDRVVQHNQAFVKPPLSNREVQTVIRSAGQRKYQYTCDQEPICSRCDRKTCLTLPFGVGHEPWKDQSNYAELLAAHCRKILTDPPRYIVEVNGHDVELASEQFFYFSGRVGFRHRIKEVLNLILAPMKEERWDMIVKELLDKHIDIEAPVDASERGMILSKVHEFLGLVERSRDREDILKGLPVEYKDTIAFRAADLQKYLHSQRIEKVKIQDLYQILYTEGCRHTKIRVKGKVEAAWLMPKDRLNLQTEDFTPAGAPRPEEDM